MSILWSLGKGAVKSVLGPGMGLGEIAARRGMGRIGVETAKGGLTALGAAGKTAHWGITNLLARPALGAAAGGFYSASQSNRPEDIFMGTVAGAALGAFAVPAAQKLITRGFVQRNLTRAAGEIGYKTSWGVGPIPRALWHGTNFAARGANRALFGKNALKNAFAGEGGKGILESMDAYAASSNSGMFASGVYGAGLIGKNILTGGGGLVGGTLKGTTNFLVKHPTFSLFGGSAALIGHSMTAPVPEENPYASGQRGVAYRGLANRAYDYAGTEGLVQGLHQGRHS